MDKYSAVIVDDEQGAIDYMSSLLSEQNVVELIASYSNPIEAIREISLHKPDVLFLDVQMPQKSGFDLLKEVRVKGYEPYIIFTTAYEKFAIRAIKHAAFDYLLKPVNEEELYNTLVKLKKSEKQGVNSSNFDQLIKRISSSVKLKFNTSTGFIVIHSDEIIYCEASGNYCEIFLTEDRRELITNNMSFVGNLLPEQDFFRVSRFNIINLNFLEKVERKNRSCYLKESESHIQLKISSSQIKLLEKHLSQEQ